MGSFSASSWNFMEEGRRGRTLRVYVLQDRETFLDTNVSSHKCLLPASRPMGPTETVSRVRYSGIFSRPGSNVSSFIRTVNTVPGLALFLSDVSVFPHFAFIFFFVFMDLISHLIIKN